MKPIGEYVFYNLRRILGIPESVKSASEKYVDGCQVVLCKKYLKDKRRD